MYREKKFFLYLYNSPGFDEIFPGFSAESLYFFIYVKFADGELVPRAHAAVASGVPQRIPLDFSLKSIHNEGNNLEVDNDGEKES